MIPPTELQVLGRLLAGGVPSPGTDWERIVALARGLKLAPLLYYCLSQEGRGGTGPGGGHRGAVPAEQWAELRQDLHRSMRFWAASSRQIGEVLEALCAARVPVVVIKGPAIQSCYPHPELRVYGDLDLWVPGDRLAEAVAALKERGYEAPEDMAPWHWSRHHHLPPLRRDGAPHLVELHRRPDYSESAGGLRPEEMWQRAEDWSIAGQRALRLETGDEVLLLAVHAVATDAGQSGLRAACDLAALTHGWSPAEWQALAERAASYELARPLYFLLLLAEALLGSLVPRQVMDRLHAATGGVSAERLTPFLEAVPVRGYTAAQKLARVAARPSRRARLRLLLDGLFLPRQDLAGAYHVPERSFRLWLARLWYPVQLAWRHARGLRLRRSDRVLLRREMWLRRWLAGGPG